MKVESLSCEMWVVQAAGTPLFLRRTGRFGELQTARLYQCESDAVYTINYNALDFCVPTKVVVTCEISHTEDATRLASALKQIGQRLGHHRDAPVVDRSTGRELPCPPVQRAIENLD